MNIKKFLKPDKNLAIKINGVEYLVDDQAVVTIERGDEEIDLIQLQDQNHYLFNRSVIKDAINEDGIVGYLDK
ncbi:MAG: hypothetical protein JST_000476 [Candidatus Parcubacteria bacterium]|jgi:hypothetical protein|nr:MAG: hypothetical protein JST_4430 [Candidatus Parcubacteria bacterium]